MQTYNDTDTDLFCAGFAHLWDGRLLFAGGDGGRKGDNAPLSNTNVYDWRTNTWRREADMAAPRWYASVAALGNGEMLTLEGSYSPSPVAEVFGLDRAWRPLDVEGVHAEGDYQWILQVPDGSVMSFGPENLVASIDTEGAGAIEVLSERDGAGLRDYGSYAMFEPGRILVAGGGIAQTSAVTIDTASGQVTDAGNMRLPRRQHNLTILADGSVLVTGGNADGAEYYSPDAGVRTPELWDPATGRFTTLNDSAADRQYHSIALLLPDGRVLSAGGGLCGECYRLGYEERNADLFSPPYLFGADGEPAVRPVLANVPPVADYGQAISLVTDAVGVSRAHLIKLGAPTHSENQDQRLVPLAHRASAGRLELVMPASRHAAPPGHYLLFVVDGAGVPSIGAMVELGQPLVRPGEDVAGTLHPGAADRYLFTANGALELALVADAPVRLAVARDAPVGAPGARIACGSTAAAFAAHRCEVEADGDARWYASVSGESSADYRIVATGARAADGFGETVGADPVRADGAGIVRTGGGGASGAPALFALGAASFARRRRALAARPASRSGTGRRDASPEGYTARPRCPSSPDRASRHRRRPR